MNEELVEKIRIDITGECINCIFNYDTIDCELGSFIEGYGDTKDEGKPEHCKVKFIEVVVPRNEMKGVEG